MHQGDFNAEARLDRTPQVRGQIQQRLHHAQHILGRDVCGEFVVTTAVFCRYIQFVGPTLHLDKEQVAQKFDQAKHKLLDIGPLVDRPGDDIQHPLGRGIVNSTDQLKIKIAVNQP